MNDWPALLDQIHELNARSGPVDTVQRLLNLNLEVHTIGQPLLEAMNGCLHHILKLPAQTLDIGINAIIRLARCNQSWNIWRAAWCGLLICCRRISYLQQSDSMGEFNTDIG